jgi:hypothetical protein
MIRMTATFSAPHDAPTVVRMSRESCAPVAARDQAGRTEQTRSDAVVGVIREWLDNSGDSQMEGVTGGPPHLR